MMSFGGSVQGVDSPEGLLGFGPDDLDITTTGGQATWDWIFQSDIVDYYDGITFDIEKISTTDPKGEGWTMTAEKWALLFKAIRLGTRIAGAPARPWGTKVWQGCMSKADWASANADNTGRCTGGSCSGKCTGGGNPGAWCLYDAECTGGGTCTGGSCGEPPAPKTTPSTCKACPGGVWKSCEGLGAYDCTQCKGGVFMAYTQQNHDCCPCPRTALPLTGARELTLANTCTLCDPSGSCPQCAGCSSAGAKSNAALTWARSGIVLG